MDVLFGTELTVGACWRLAHARPGDHVLGSVTQVDSSPATRGVELLEALFSSGTIIRRGDCAAQLSRCSLTRSHRTTTRVRQACDPGSPARWRAPIPPLWSRRKATIRRSCRRQPVPITYKSKVPLTRHTTTSPTLMDLSMTHSCAALSLRVDFTAVCHRCSQRRHAKYCAIEVRRVALGFEALHRGQQSLSFSGTPSRSSIMTDDTRDSRFVTRELSESPLRDFGEPCETIGTGCDAGRCRSVRDPCFQLRQVDAKRTFTPRADETARAEFAITQHAFDLRL